MNSFTYYVPTNVYFGADTEQQTGQTVRAYGGTKALVIYGGGSAEKSGLLNRITDSLQAAGVDYILLGGVRPNPVLAFAQKAVEEHRDKGIDFLLGVGGGSVLDTCKAVAIGLTSPDIPVWDYFTRKVPVTTALPVGAVLTIAAAGSETSSSAVLTDEISRVKRGVGTALNRPRFAILNPELTYTLPPRQTACGVADIMLHTLDRYFAPDTDNALTDGIAEALLRTTITYGTIAMEFPKDYKARSELMWCGSLSHNDLTGLGQGRDFSVHALGHELSAMFDLPHGESLTVMWSHWARHVLHTSPARFAKLARTVWSVTASDDIQAAQEGIRATEDYFTSLGLPICFSQAMGVQRDTVLQELSVRATFGHTRKVGIFHPMEAGEICEVFRAANH